MSSEFASTAFFADCRVEIHAKQFKDRVQKLVVNSKNAFRQDGTCRRWVLEHIAPVKPEFYMRYRNNLPLYVASRDGKKYTVDVRWLLVWSGLADGGEADAAEWKAEIAATGELPDPAHYRLAPACSVGPMCIVHFKLVPQTSLRNQRIITDARSGTKTYRDLEEKYHLDQRQIQRIIHGLGIQLALPPLIPYHPHPTISLVNQRRVIAYHAQSIHLARGWNWWAPKCKTSVGNFRGIILGRTGHTLTRPSWVEHYPTVYEILVSDNYPECWDKSEGETMARYYLIKGFTGFDGGYGEQWNSSDPKSNCLPLYSQEAADSELEVWYRFVEDFESKHGKDPEQLKQEEAVQKAEGMRRLAELNIEDQKH